MLLNAFNCVLGCRTHWFNLDTPSGQGDYETVLRLQMLHPTLVCSQPVAIEAMTVSGNPAHRTGDIFQMWVAKSRTENNKNKNLQNKSSVPVSRIEYFADTMLLVALPASMPSNPLEGNVKTTKSASHALWLSAQRQLISVDYSLRSACGQVLNMFNTWDNGRGEIQALLYRAVLRTGDPARVFPCRGFVETDIF